MLFSASFLELGGDRDVAVEYLSTSYTGVPKMINLLMQWLQIAGCKQKEIQAMVEEHFTSVILKHFDPKKADHVLVEGGEVRGWVVMWVNHILCILFCSHNVSEGCD